MEEALTPSLESTENKAERNNVLLQRYTKGEKHLANVIVLENEGLVNFVLSRNRWLYGDGANGVITKDDCYQEGILALYLALDGFNPDLGRFSTYAIKAVTQSLYRFYNDKGHTIRKPEFRHLQYSKLKRCEEEQTALHGRKPSLKTLSVLTEISSDDILKLGRDFSPVISYDTPISDGEASDTLLEVIADETDFLEDVEKRMTLKVLRQDLEGFMEAHLAKNEIDIIKRFYAWDRAEKDVDSKLCDKYNLTKSALRNKIASILRKLGVRRNYLANEYLELISTRIRSTSIDVFDFLFERRIISGVACEVIAPGHVISLISNNCCNLISIHSVQHRFIEYIKVIDKDEKLETQMSVLSFFDIKDFRTEKGRIVELYI